MVYEVLYDIIIPQCMCLSDVWKWEKNTKTTTDGDTKEMAASIYPCIFLLSLYKVITARIHSWTTVNYKNSWPKHVGPLCSLCSGHYYACRSSLWVFVLKQTTTATGIYNDDGYSGKCIVQLFSHWHTEICFYCSGSLSQFYLTRLCKFRDNNCKTNHSSGCHLRCT